MKTFIILTAMFGGIGTASATTDYTCLNDCVASGYRRPLCVSKCSYDSGGGYQQPTQIKQTDYTCLNDCQNAGYRRPLCVEKCSY